MSQQKFDVRFVVIAALLWCAPTFPLLVKYFGTLAGLALCALSVPAIGIGMRLFERWRGRGLFADNRATFVALWLLGMVLFAVLYPLSKSGLFGLGSDRDSALNNGMAALFAGENPYLARSDFGNPIFILPGAFLLAAPFYVLGNGILQNAFWLAAFLLFCARIFAKRATALLYMIVFFFGTIGCLHEFVTGGDYVVNVFVVAIACGIAMWAHDAPRNAGARIAAAMFFGVALCVRPTYLVMLPLVTTYVFQTSGAARAFAFAGIATATATALTLPFYLVDPAHFTPAQLGVKLDALPAGLRHLAPASTLAIACAGVAVTLDRARVFGIAALALLPAFVPQLVLAVFERGWRPEVVKGAGYLVPVTLLGGLWLVLRYEQGRFAPRE